MRWISHSAIVLALALTAVPALSQQSQPPSPPTEQEPSVIGLTVYSSDGEMLGNVTHVATRASQTALRTEMGTFLGLGPSAPSAVLIDAGLYKRKGDRIELTLTAAQVRDTIAKQNKGQGQ